MSAMKTSCLLCCWLPSSFCYNSVSLTSASNMWIGMGSYVGAWGPMGTPSKRMILHLASTTNCQWHLSKEWVLENISPICFRAQAGFILFRSCAGTHGCSELRSETATPYSEDSMHRTPLHPLVFAFFPCPPQWSPNVDGEEGFIEMSHLGTNIQSFIVNTLSN